MAQIGGEGGGGRESNVELNLVPFIDLMSVCIIFLLVTAFLEAGSRSKWVIHGSCKSNGVWMRFGYFGNSQGRSFHSSL